MASVYYATLHVLPRQLMSATFSVDKLCGLLYINVRVTYKACLCSTPLTNHETHEWWFMNITAKSSLELRERENPSNAFCYLY